MTAWRYKLYNPNADIEIPKAFIKIDSARKYAMNLLKQDWSIGYISVKQIRNHTYETKVLGMVVRNVRDYYTPEKILKFDWIVDDNDPFARKRIVRDIKSDGSLGARRL